MERNNQRTDDNRTNKIKKKMSGGQKAVAGLLGGLILGILCMWAIYAGLGQSMMVDKAKYDRFVKAESIYDCINQYYYEEADPDSLTDGMYKGIVEGLDDPYSSYMTKKEYKEYVDKVSGEFSGVGLALTVNDKKQVVVVSAIDESPAQKAGLKTGDILLKIDGKEYSDLNDVLDGLKGKKGTKVKVEYLRGDDRKSAVIVRDDIKAESVTSSVTPENIGYIRITQFINDTAEDFDKAVKELEGKNVDGLIIDLRNNGGGLVKECLDVADELLDECVIVCYVDNAGNKTYSRAEDGKTELEYVILVDEGTASASEIVTAAVKDNKGGKIVGKRTFGKGVIQRTSEFGDGSAVKLTVMQYLSPDGDTIHKKGIKPDYVVSNKNGKDLQLEKAVEILKD